jgi:3',5'-cyclic AMP phosphodiesterase CpdA
MYGANPALADQLPTYLAGDWGLARPAAGEPYIARTLDGSPAPVLGPGARRLVRFAHLADLQLADDQSPTRVGFADLPALSDAAIRTQDPDLCRMSNAAVRTINALHREDPIAFTLLGGDNADSAQANELDWALAILDGDEVACRSEPVVDLVPGPDNDGKDPFIAEGLLMPWKWVTGNHDVLVQGNAVVDDGEIAIALGDVAALGTRDDALGGRLTRAAVADPTRTPLRRKDIMRKVAASGDGHGVGPGQVAAGKAFYSFDVPGTPLRFIVLDTACETGGAGGLLRQGDIDANVQPVLDDAKAEGKWVVLAAHHPYSSLGDGGDTFGTVQPDAVLPDQWLALLGSYDNVLLTIDGHTHRHAVRPVQPPGGHAFWDIVTGAIADYPFQFRLVEVWDGDNGYVLIRATVVDFAVDDDPVAAEGRRLGLIDYTAGWGKDGYGMPEDRNVELWIKRPPGAVGRGPIPHSGP